MSDFTLQREAVVARVGVGMWGGIRNKGRALRKICLLQGEGNEQRDGKAERG